MTERSKQNKKGSKIGRKMKKGRKIKIIGRK
jgi:hypothetical protein